MGYWQCPMEDLVAMFGGVYKNRRVLITGNTGFKGSWLALWLQSLGANLAGVALPPETQVSHWELLKLDMETFYIDIRDQNLLRETILHFNPEIVFHLAAQPLVRRSYSNPLETWEINVMGTANLLDICRRVDGLGAIVIVTTDKCYENRGWVWGYREIDPLGGHDPYSASKAGSELVVGSYRLAFFNRPGNPLLATARAGNVIGGGDWSEDRLIPDIVRAFEEGQSLEIRSPKATRPWQHVLECLSGYLMLGQQLFSGDKEFANAWNFGPDREGNRQVIEVLDAIKEKWGSVSWHYTAQPQPYEAQLLHLDSSKAREKLLWRPVLTFDEMIAYTSEWYHAWLSQRDVISLTQLKEYIRIASDRGLTWVKGEIE
jgi:CDP-glucose 4,6-dehydratase